MENILSFENVSYSYTSDKEVLDGINIDFKSGKFYTIIGQSGSGKTTLISLACGLDYPSSGNINYKGKSLKSISLEKYRNKYVSIIFQGYNLLNYMNAIENITSAMSIKGIKTNDNKQFAVDMLKRVGISKEQGIQKTLTLSGGQQQRVAIARALCCECELIIADEPTGNLDEDTSKEIIALFKDIVINENKTVIMVTHNKDIAIESDETYLVKDKELIKVNLPKDFDN
ncbi:ABC transporter ATP-binding protein,Lipoprotein-releasing system ATP-binding protein LolD,macrolide transporter ATP-binding /permease protein,Predicted ABC-type transport system involved in lysophospholipase L1 biosynthesis, ATPase component,putative bacteriocin export ABC transporter, lactococcin 972 group,ABC transporter [[Clostridium] sordellii]|uniref:ABC transporter ATP-binding protein n=1 Tax=Paraclostridium sordellii TaxID=1505 RepID=UPI000541D9EB|nr:ABC transporter ATP-binding protein [Paeniclostridium sordellii]CEK33615.1 ABC transporter ATP-binding protein,Lipoprotein-releasing system ATP-binding protein LolD,macrolide transporter ATP-binding /permease protein,Predicted ABC-type transport system involved in lysophospholipase L1 biosynthesis, ATPase component,putative bacteriocin export ABC transporter, lactococcin 972 group,ABC transporter [[Clostridium] sordellii] [Paeniclostridium sordellii]